LWPCDHLGRYADGTPRVAGRAAILDGAAAESANRALHRRYGWQYNVIPMLKLPGVKNVHSDLSLREKLRRATSRSVWPDSAIVEVKLDLGAVGRRRG
jgi:PPOX class probable F420-dependent enzyme